MLRLALYQPDIPQNTGTMLRMAACLGVAVEIVEPAELDAFKWARQKSKLAGTIRGSFFVIKGEY